MTWYLWLIAAYAALGFVAPLFLYGQHVPQSFGAFVGSIIIRPLILWGLASGGTPMALVIALAALFLVELIIAASQIDTRVRASGQTILWNSLVWGSVAWAVIAAAQS